MNNYFEAFITLFVGIAIGVSIAANIGTMVLEKTTTEFEKKAIENKCAQYNQVTGEFEFIGYKND